MKTTSISLVGAQYASSNLSMINYSQRTLKKNQGMIFIYFFFTEEKSNVAWHSTKQTYKIKHTIDVATEPTMFNQCGKW